MNEFDENIAAPAGEAQEVSEVSEPVRDTRGQWFVIHTLSGHENKVRDKIKYQLDNGDEVPVYEALIPTEKVTESRNGKKTTSTRKLFPGYVWVRMDLYKDGEVDEKAWYFVRNIQGVLGFLGDSRRFGEGQTRRPTPLSEREVEELQRMIASGENAPARPKINFVIGEIVRIKDGSFENFEGEIQEIDVERGKLSLMVQIFGRSTPVEVEFGQVERTV